MVPLQRVSFAQYGHAVVFIFLLDPCHYLKILLGPLPIPILIHAELTTIVERLLMGCILLIRERDCLFHEFRDFLFSDIVLVGAIHGTIPKVVVGEISGLKESLS
ncbi:hypothetical protein ACFE04_007065 [Oxalis oulophora]